ncbi:hypothetical protein PVMG_06034 [Plasmodium vivax Mauritania I]|uniref:VIR protein n=1 Tax=Plasmodium vivax Mauritania I TaxID=1035515 RepID=A0A0J9TEW1_PLAVI|nr:hypothetical protein PVMG_06034 [Plasmodium vivax Mauritania I]
MSKSESENTFDPDNFIKEDSGLNTSKLFKFYQSLDAKKGTNNNNPASDADEQKKNLNELENYLKNIFSEWDSICKSTGSGEVKCCEYLNYWLYGKIAEKKLNFFRIHELLGNLEKHIETKSSTINKVDCTRNLVKYGSKEVLHNKKILYDFLEYYIYLNNEWSKIEENAKGEYCKYITYIFKLYNKLYEEDSQWGLLHKYENELKLFRTIFEKENALSSLKSKCNIDNLLIKPFKDVKTTDINRKFIEIKKIYSTFYIFILQEKVLNDLPSFQIYNELGNYADDKEYKSVYCDKLSESNDNNKNIKKMCIKLLRNLKKLPELAQMKNESHTDRCLYLNFWIYDELSKIYKITEENIFDVPEVAKFLNADIEINKDLIEKDLNKNYNIIVPPSTAGSEKTEVGSQKSDATAEAQKSQEKETTPETEANKGDQVKESKVVETRAVNNEPASTVKNQETHASGDNSGKQASADNPGIQASGDSTGTQVSGDDQAKKSPSDIINYKAYSKYNPCFFFLNYNCKFSECREMKHLYEYFKDYETIKKKINCDQRKNDKYYKYLTYISSLYNKHKDEEGCCSWGANMCPNYFLKCDEAYDPRKLVEALESGNSTECTRIKKSAGDIKTEAKSVEDKLRNSMYIKYMTCSYIPGSHFNKKGLICQQQSQRPHINNKFLSRYTSYNPPINISTPISKNITVNGKPMNVVLISNPKASITEEDLSKSETVHLSKSKSGYYSALFPEVTEKVRAYYLEEAEKACPKEQPVGEMSEYCKKSKQYNKIINLSNSQSANVTLEKDIENWEDIVIPDDTSFLNEILQQLPVRMGAVSLASLGAITMLFMYYKV